MHFGRIHGQNLFAFPRTAFVRSVIMQKYHSDPLRKEFIHSTIANLQKIADGKSCSGAPNDKEKMLIGELSALI